MRGVFDSAGPDALAFTRTSVLPSALLDAVGTLDFCDFGAHLLRDTQPTYAPVQRFKCVVTAALAWLGVRMVATPFLYDSFIHYFTPVYPDAIQAEACPTYETQSPGMAKLQIQAQLGRQP